MSKRILLLLACLLPISGVLAQAGAALDVGLLQWNYYALASLNGADGGDYADWDGDGIHDICVAAEEGAREVCYLLGGAAVRPVVVGTWSGTGPEDVAIGDLTGDGKPDLAFFHQNELKVGFLHCSDNANGNTCSRVILLQTPHAVHNGFIADVDQDGYADIVYASARWDGNVTPGMQVVWLENPLPLDPTAPANWTKRIIGQDSTDASSAWGFTATGDYNRLGFVDLLNNGVRYLVVSERPSRRVSFYRGDDPYQSGWNRSVIAVQGSGEPKHMTAQDLDSDGDLDIAMTTRQGAILVWENKSLPNWFTFVQYQIDVIDSRGIGVSPMGIGLHDLDGDGRFELVVNEYHPSVPTNVYVYKMNTLSNWTRYTIASNTYAGDDIFFGDFNGDGRADIFSTWASTSGGQVYVLQQIPPLAPRVWLPVVLK